MLQVGLVCRRIFQFAEGGSGGRRQVAGRTLRPCGEDKRRLDRECPRRCCCPVRGSGGSGRGSYENLALADKAAQTIATALARSRRGPPGGIKGRAFRRFTGEI